MACSLVEVSITKRCRIARLQFRIRKRDVTIGRLRLYPTLKSCQSRLNAPRSRNGMRPIVIIGKWSLDHQ